MVAADNGVVVISAVDRTLAVLEALAGNRDGLTITGLVQAINVEKSVVSRVVSTLEADGYVVRSEATGRLKIGLRFLGIALRHIDRAGIWDACLPPMRRLGDATGELVQLAMEDGIGLTYVAKVDSENNRLRHVSIIGSRAILHASASGRVWLASFSESEAAKLLAKSDLEKVTPSTNTDFSKIMRELQRVKRQGYSIILGESVEGVNAVAVPVPEPEGRVIGALSIAAPAVRFDSEKMISLVAMMADLAAEIGRALPVGFVRQTAHAEWPQRSTA